MLILRWEKICKQKFCFYYHDLLKDYLTLYTFNFWLQLLFNNHKKTHKFDYSLTFVIFEQKNNSCDFQGLVIKEKSLLSMQCSTVGLWQENLWKCLQLMRSTTSTEMHHSLLQLFVDADTKLYKTEAEEAVRQHRLNGSEIHWINHLWWIVEIHQATHSCQECHF